MDGKVNKSKSKRAQWIGKCLAALPLISIGTVLFAGLSYGDAHSQMVGFLMAD